MDTPLLRELYAKDPAKAARRLIHLPMGRFAAAQEIASAALFLASDESSYITASTFMVDGGLSGAYVTPEYWKRSGRRAWSGAAAGRIGAGGCRGGERDCPEACVALRWSAAFGPILLHERAAAYRTEG